MKINKIFKIIVGLTGLVMVIFTIATYSSDMSQNKDNNLVIIPNEAYAGFETKCYAPQTSTGPSWPKCAEGCPYVHMRNPQEVGTCKGGST